MESGTGATTKRAVKFSGTLKNLCNRAPYALGIHENNKVDCRCKDVGEPLSIILEDVRATKTGGLTISTDNLPLSLIRTDLNPSSLIGSSCVLSVPPYFEEKCRNCPKVICAPVKLIPACQINSL